MFKRYLSPDADSVAGGSADDAAADKDKGKKKKQPEKKESVLELTQEELDAKVAAAVKAREDQIAADAKVKEEAAEAERKKKAGEFEKLYQSEVEARKADQARASAAELSVKSKDVDIKLRDHLAAEHKDYPATVAQYIKPLIKFDEKTTDADIDKAIKASAAQYVKDNPRAPHVGAPERTFNRKTGVDAPPSDNDKPRPLPHYMRS